MTQLVCSTCGAHAAPLDWRCAVCGFPLEVENFPRFDAAKIDSSVWSLWRYAAMLPVEQRFTLGAGMTPLVESELDGVHFCAKLEYLNPTGSYKDRGVETLLNYLVGEGVDSVVADSSGNAGSAVALYAAAAGIKARIFVPQSAPAGKKRAITIAAEIVEVPGPRSATTEACMEVVKRGEAVYATHAWNPQFITGQMTTAWEIWEQNGRRAPGAVVCPVGQGLLLLGLLRGFKALKDAGLIAALPRIFAIQAAASDPIVRAYETEALAPVPVMVGPSAADGIVIGQPVRGAQILAAIRESNGAAIRVEEEAILPARDALARRGLFVEPTSAVTAAALPQIRAQYDGDLVLVLTGHGLKAL